MRKKGVFLVRIVNGVGALHVKTKQNSCFIKPLWWLELLLWTLNGVCLYTFLLQTCTDRMIKTSFNIDMGVSYGQVEEC